MADKKTDAKNENAEEAPVPEADLEAGAAEAEGEPGVDDVAAATEPVAEEPPAEEPVAVAPPVAPADQSAAEPVVEAEPVAPEAAPSEPAAATVSPPQSGPKPKKKRLPRPLRPVKTRPTRAKAAERKPIVRLEKPEHERGRSQERLGTVVSDAMDKTIVVKVDVIKSHRKYKKVVRRSVKFHAHDETNSAHVGDTVRIVETRPLSATKRWRLTEIVEVAK